MKEIKGFRTYWDEFRKIAYPVTHINAVIGYNGETLAENLKVINKAIESLSAITPEEFNKIKDDIKTAVNDLEKFKNDLAAKEEEYKQLTEQAHTELNNAINSAKNALEQALKDADSIHEEINQAVEDVNTAIKNLGNVATKEDIENALQPYSLCAKKVDMTSLATGIDKAYKDTYISSSGGTFSKIGYATTRYDLNLLELFDAKVGDILKIYTGPEVDYAPMVQGGNYGPYKVSNLENVEGKNYAELVLTEEHLNVNNYGFTIWLDNPYIEIVSGKPGQVLTKTEDGAEWKDTNLDAIESTLRDLSDQYDNAIELITDERQDRIQADKDLQDHVDIVIADYTSDIQKQINELDKSLDNYATKNELDVVETLAESVNKGLGDAIERLDEDEEKIDNLESSLAEKANITDLSNVIAEEVVDGTNFEDYDKITREQLKKDLFIDMWNIACADTKAEGGYNNDTGYFELNGLTDITYTEAIEIYTYSFPIANMSTNILNKIYRYILKNIRTLFPITIENHGSTVDISSLFQYAKIKKIVFQKKNNYSSYPTNIENVFKSDSITEIRNFGVANKVTGTDTAFSDCKNLVILELDNLMVNLSLRVCSLLNYYSFNYIISHAKNTSPINITVHQNVYNALLNQDTTYLFNGGTQQEWQQLLQDATDKQISFITA